MADVLLPDALRDLVAARSHRHDRTVDGRAPFAAPAIAQRLLRETIQ